MSDKSDNKCCNGDLDKSQHEWNVEAIIGIDEKGQMVIPKDIREKANLGAGDKIALISSKRENEICCILLVKSDKLVGTISEIINR